MLSLAKLSTNQWHLLQYVYNTTAKVYCRSRHSPRPPLSLLPPTLPLLLLLPLPNTRQPMLKLKIGGMPEALKQHCCKMRSGNIDRTSLIATRCVCLTHAQSRGAGRVSLIAQGTTWAWLEAEANRKGMHNAGGG